MISQSGEKDITYLCGGISISLDLLLIHFSIWAKSFEKNKTKLISAQLKEIKNVIKGTWLTFVVANKTSDQ